MKFLALAALVSQVAAVWPAPRSFTQGNSVVWISKDFSVKYNGQRLFTRDVAEDFNSGSIDSTWVVQAAVQRTYESIFFSSFVPWKLHPRNRLDQFEPAPGAAKTYIRTLTITQTGKDNSTTFKPLAGQVDESYKLNVGADGSAAITAVSSIGVLRALETFTQLFYLHSKPGVGIYSNIVPVAVDDAPKFAHRGLNMDVSRNWYPKEHILHAIDALSWNKFNVLHIHMTDAQSWPIEIPTLPDLAEKGAYQSSLTYSPKDIQEIQSYGTVRGVEVIIEMDMPGHTTSIGRAYPDLITAYDATPWGTYCAEPPCGSLKLNSSAVSSFLEKLFDDVLPRVSPYSAYFHTGGDEINVNAYALDDTIRSNLTSVIQPYLQKFTDRNHNQIRQAGLAPIVWEEIALDWNITLGSDVVVQTWVSEDSLAAVTSKGYKAIFGNYEYWYLDCGKGQWLNFYNGASFQKYYPFLDYCSPTKNWRLIYSYDPTAHLTAEQAALVVGGEISIWSEQTDPVNWDDMVWPRASAAGEVMWSGRQDANGQNRSQIDAAPRLADLRERMVSRGVKCGPVQMIFCTQSNATECAL